MANSSQTIPIDKVCEVIKSMSAMGVWGTFTLNFEEGNVTKLLDNFIWKAGESEEPGFVIGPSEQIKKLKPISKGRMVIKTKTGTGG